MSDAKPHLDVLEEVEWTSIPGLVEVLREEGLVAARYVLWEATGLHRDYSPPALRSQPTQEQTRIGWEMTVRIEKILATVLHEAHMQQIEETMNTLAEGREGFYE